MDNRTALEDEQNNQLDNSSVSWSTETTSTEISPTIPSTISTMNSTAIPSTISTVVSTTISRMISTNSSERSTTMQFILTGAAKGSNYNLIIGTTLAVASCVFIGSSFIVKKKALLKINRESLSRAGLGGYGYLKEWMWWLGLLLMGIGELANLVAYAFAPATLVTPLGAISVIVSAVLATYVLKESLNIIGKVGCLMCILGSVVVVLHAPQKEVVYDMEILESMLVRPGFLIYAVLVVIIALILMYYFGPRYGNTNMLIYITICSVIGSLSVMACKGIGVAVTETIEGVNQFANWLTWFCIISLFATVSVQMNYLNRALDIYNTSIVSPIYYVFFTTAVLIASAILFREWADMSATNLVGVFTGFVIIICATFLLNVFKDQDITMTTVREYLANSSPSQTSLLHHNDTTSGANSHKKNDNGSRTYSKLKEDYESISNSKAPITNSIHEASQMDSSEKSQKQNFVNSI